ncbi:MAG: iron ABC transporter permease [Bacteroidales bacterium]|nr:iron ABC transporter permease [Bacteroidales bacterium]
MSRLLTTIIFVSISIVLGILILIDLSTGQIEIPFREIINFLSFGNNQDENYYILVKEFRFPRVLVAILTGAALSVSGLLMQSIFRNPLAGPYVLGISSGASLGVALFVLGGSVFAGTHAFWGSNVSLLISAGVGAAVVMSIILAVSIRVRDNISILIIGILIAGVVSSIVSILQYYANDISVKSFVVWTMGNLDAVSYKDIMLIFPIIVFGLAGVYLMSKNLNLILPGESFAKSMGINTKVQRIIVFTFVSLLTGTVTAFCGPIGFIGIAAPHVARWIFNTANHFVLIPASSLIGAIFIVSSDILTHSITTQGILPINAVTAIMGAPFIIWIVVRNKRTVI